MLKRSEKQQTPVVRAAQIPQGGTGGGRGGERKFLYALGNISRPKRDFCTFCTNTSSSFVYCPKTDTFSACSLIFIFVSIIHRTQTWTTGPLTCVCNLSARVYTRRSPVYRVTRRTSHWQTVKGRNRTLKVPSRRTGEKCERRWCEKSNSGKCPAYLLPALSFAFSLYHQWNVASILCLWTR